jgi:hypothetical protein
MSNLNIQLIEQQEINVQNMNVELVAQMFKNYQSNVLFHLEGWFIEPCIIILAIQYHMLNFSANNNNGSHRQLEGASVMSQGVFGTIVVQRMGTQIPIQVVCRARLLGNHVQLARQGRHVKIYGSIKI